MVVLSTVSTRICKQYSKGSCQKSIMNIFSILHNSFSKHSFFLVVLSQTARAVWPYPEPSRTFPNLYLGSLPKPCLDLRTGLKARSAAAAHVGKSHAWLGAIKRGLWNGTPAFLDRTMSVDALGFEVWELCRTGCFRMVVLIDSTGDLRWNGQLKGNDRNQGQNLKQKTQKSFFNRKVILLIFVKDLQDNIISNHAVPEILVFSSIFKRQW